MSAMTPVPKDHPLMLAWEAYKATDEYANTKKWAAYPEHVDGSLWAAFEQGWRAVHSACTEKIEGYEDPLGEYALDLEQALSDLVTLKDIKERMEAGTASQVERDYYAGQKEVAWAAARVALEEKPAEPHRACTSENQP